MQGKTQKALVLQEYGKPVILKEVPIPELKDGELLVKVEASTVNPSDRLFLQGHYVTKPKLPVTAGFEGVGEVVDVKGETVKDWKGKHVCFTSQTGTWAHYTVLTPHTCFEIEKDVPLASSASGVVNPLTVLGFIDNYKNLKGTGIIHTAAASSLGRMLNKLCQKQKIPLLNIVRRQQQAELLKKQGATHVIITSKAGWEKQFNQLVHKQHLNVVYDALGGGSVTDAILENLPPNSHYHLYGALQGKPITLSKPGILFSGLHMSAFHVFAWWGKASQQVQTHLRKQYSKYLKNQLSTSTFKELPLSQIQQAIELSSSKATEGKILLKIQ